MSVERDALSEQIHLLGDLLGQTLVEQEGQPLFDLVEEIRALAKAHRGGDGPAGERLLRRVEALPLAEALLAKYNDALKLVSQGISTA